LAQIKERVHPIQASKQGVWETYQHKEEETPIAAPTGPDGERRRPRSVAAAGGGAGEEEEGDRFARATDGRGIFDIFLGKLGRLFLQVCHHVISAIRQGS